MVVSVIEITQIALLVMVGRTEPLMARIIRHDAIVRKGRDGGRRSEVGSADGSLSEVEAHLLFAHRLHFIDEATLDRLLQYSEKTRGPLRGLIQRLR
jgi:hypothetical protein